MRKTKQNGKKNPKCKRLTCIPIPNDKTLLTFCMTLIMPFLMFLSIDFWWVLWVNHVKSLCFLPSGHMRFLCTVLHILSLALNEMMIIIATHKITIHVFISIKWHERVWRDFLFFLSQVWMWKCNQWYNKLSSTF